MSDSGVDIPLTIKELIADVRPSRTVLFFGSGSSIPSNAPSVAELQGHFEQVFGVQAQGYTLAEQTAIIEHRTRDRARLIKELRVKFKGLTPTGALLNLPLYDWKSIFTTNYDTLIEESYRRRSAPLYAYSSNFDFGVKEDPRAVQLFKLHGTLEKDVGDGDRSRIILTSNDYDLASEFREQLFDRFKADIAGAHLLAPVRRWLYESLRKRRLSAEAQGNLVHCMLAKLRPSDRWWRQPGP